MLVVLLIAYIVAAKFLAGRVEHDGIIWVAIVVGTSLLVVVAALAIALAAFLIALVLALIWAAIQLLFGILIIVGIFGALMGS